MTVPRRLRRSSAGDNQINGGGSPELSYRQWMGARRPPGGSPCSSASNGAGRSGRGALYSPESSSRRRPELGHRRLGATARFTKNWWDLRLPEETLSTPTCSGAACGCCNRGGDMAGGGERSALVVDASRGESRNEARGKRCNGSPRFFWCCWRGRGGTGSGETTVGITGTRGRNRRRWRCSRASGAV